MFERRKEKKKLIQPNTLKNITPVRLPSELCSDEKRLMLLKGIQEAIGLDALRYETLCQSLIDTYIEYVQQLPDAHNTYYADIGGLLDYALSRTEAALHLFKDYLLYNPKKGLTQPQLLWQYALFSAALLQGIGKLSVDYQIERYDEDEKSLGIWQPLYHSLAKETRYYAYSFESDEHLVRKDESVLRKIFNGLLGRQLMPEAGFSWIASDKKVLSVWLYLLHEEMESAGILGAILKVAKARAEQRQIEKLLQDMPNKRTGNARRATFIENTNPLDLQLIGLQFLQWLKNMLMHGELAINSVYLLIVSGGLMLHSELFRLFIEKQPEYRHWQLVRKGLLSLKLHQGATEADPLLLTDVAMLLPDRVAVSHDKMAAKTMLSATDFMHLMQTESDSFIKTGLINTLPHMLTPEGVWQAGELALSAAMLFRQGY